MFLYREIVNITAYRTRIKIARLGYERGPEESYNEKRMNRRIRITS